MVSVDKGLQPSHYHLLKGGKAVILYGIQIFQQQDHFFVFCRRAQHVTKATAGLFKRTMLFCVQQQPSPVRNRKMVSPQKGFPRQKQGGGSSKGQRFHAEPDGLIWWLKWKQSIKIINQKQKEKEKYFLKRDENVEVIYSSQPKSLVFQLEILGSTETLSIKVTV